jgi:uncharacterized repeat protein (TIGR03803 family)
MKRNCLISAPALLLLLTFQPIAMSQHVATRSPRAHYQVLYRFQNSPDGSQPWAELVRDSAGNLYGTTYQGGANMGTVFKVDSNGKETVLYTFPNSVGSDGAKPFSPLILDNAGNLYGTTAAGGGAFDAGTVLRINKRDKETVLYSFQGSPDGQLPVSGLLRDAAGNLFGTTVAGGDSGNGTVFHLDKSGKETVLYSFAGGTDGSAPNGSLARDAAGNFYGTTSTGAGSGCYDRQGCGSVFMLDRTGKEIVLHKFTGGKDGSLPYADVIRDAAGNLYGTTSEGGAFDKGTVFKLDKTGKETMLYYFTGGKDGAFPYGRLLRDGSGNLYGTSGGGGAFGKGTVFKLDATGKKEIVLHSFAGGSDGEQPVAGLIRDAAGNFYGTTLFGGDVAQDGVVFKITP